MDQKTDEKTLASNFLQSHGETEFRALYKCLTPALYQFALRLCSGSETDALEITQSVWIRAIEKLEGFNWQSTLKTWLIAIACNCRREQIRQRSKSQELDQDELARASSKVPAHEEIIDLERFIRLLPDGSREVLLLHDLEGYTHKEIAELLDIDDGTSKSQLSRARSAMRRYLSETYLSQGEK